MFRLAEATDSVCHGQAWFLLQAKVRRNLLQLKIMPDLVCRWTQAWCGGQGPCPRSSHAAVVSSKTKSMIVLGGQSKGEVFADCYSLDLDHLIWHQVVMITTSHHAYSWCTHIDWFYKLRCLHFIAQKHLTSVPGTMAFKLELQQHVNELNILMSGTFEFLSIDDRDKSSRLVVLDMVIHNW